MCLLSFVCCLCFSILKKHVSVYFREFSIKQNCVVASSAKAKSLDNYNRIDEIAGGENTVIVQKQIIQNEGLSLKDLS